ncbi:Hsp70 family protein [Mycobacterium sp. ITM-2016-00318]|uniref:Hsp70 family protein n=1 Tax=Mycobacterium sp. ITM-2016-00318 TaxID=2099693 RepID=UPI000CF90DBC|nr:Hsp70 family protein [Mycobacterium sp. ITM-2016-00318]WNG93259.1 Hsp70 family protein [Mycobacterium sp. ITM-2016-00318]
MSTPLGLSIGATNLVAARVGRPPVMRRAVLTLFPDRPPEVGAPAENPALGQPGVVLSGFVDRVGDPVPLVAEDGSSHSAEQVLVEALDAMTNAVGGGRPVAIAVPAHWGPAVVGALRGALRDKPNLSPGGVPAALIPESVAALTALQAAPGLPAGVIALVDLGGSGTSISLADANENLTPVGETVRYAEFSGDQIDQAILNHVILGVADANNADPAGTAAVGSLTRLRDECRQAKERLSADTATAVPVDLPGFSSDVRLTRAELDNLIAGPLAGLLAAVAETLERNNIAPSALAGVTTVGGGAGIPLVTQRLSEQFRVPVITTPQSQLNTAAGAALLADQELAADAPTGLSPFADSATGIAPTAWAAGAAGLAASQSAADGAESATHRALAWSQDDAIGDEPVPYTGSDYAADVYSGATDARPAMDFATDTQSQYEAEPAPLPWYKRPPILFGAAAAAAVLAIGGLAVTLTSGDGVLGPVTETSTTFSIGPSTEPPPTSAGPTTVTVTGSDGQPTTTIVTPPPPSSTSTTTTPTTTSATTTTSTTTTTTTTTTTATTTTTRTTTPTTTTSPPAPRPQPEPEPEPEPVPPAGSG